MQIPKFFPYIGYERGVQAGGLIWRELGLEACLHGSGDGSFPEEGDRF